MLHKMMFYILSLLKCKRTLQTWQLALERHVLTPGTSLALLHSLWALLDSGEWVKLTLVLPALLVVVVIGGEDLGGLAVVNCLW
mgnify:CR=1 FL=1